MTGCCGKKKSTYKKNNSLVFKRGSKKTNKKDTKNQNKSNSIEFGDFDLNVTNQSPLRAQDELTSELYEKLDYANSMFKNHNYDGALREISRIQQNQASKDDPYLRMQTWALSAMIYDKTGKNSRRKRSYTKMIETMEELKKDSRYKKSYEDGMICQGLIASATHKGDKKYDFK